MNSVSCHNRLVERQSRLRAIPANEFVNGVPIAPLRLRRTQTVQDGSLRVVEVRKSELRPWQGFLLGMCILASRQWAAASLPPTTRSPRHRSKGRVARYPGSENACGSRIVQHPWPLPLGLVWDPTKSLHPSARAEWAKCIARGTRSSIAK
jgi:hypothetical protein